MIPEETFMTIHGIPTPPVSPILIPLVGGGVLASGWLLGKTTKAMQTGVELGKVMANMLIPLIPVGVGLAIMLKATTETEKKIGMLSMLGGGAIALIVALSMLKK